MTDDAEISSEKDPHPLRHKAMLMGLVWLAVYPTVTLLTYLTADLDAPTFLRTFLTTALTVPLITFVVVPNAKRLISKADRKA